MCVRDGEMAVLTDQDIDLDLPDRALLSCHLLSLRLSELWHHLVAVRVPAQARMHSRLRLTARSSHCLCSHLSRIDKVVASVYLSAHRFGD